MKCEKCNKEHDGSFGSGRFCSRACACTRQHSYETKKKISNTLSPNKEYKEHDGVHWCLYCGKKIDGRVNNFCCLECHKSYQYLIYINKWKLGLVDGSKANGMCISNHVRRYLWEKYNNKCSRCGWNTPNSYIDKIILEVEHIDGNSTNNKEENLDLICPNCHSLTKTYKALNTGNGNRNRHRYYGLID